MNIREFFEVSKQAIAVSHKNRTRLLMDLVKLASGYQDQRAMLQRSFCEGRAVVWTKAVTAEALSSPKFDCKLVSSSIGCDVSRLLKYRKDKQCREVLGLGIALGILHCSETGVQEDIPYQFHSTIAGLCRAAPLLAADRVIRPNQSYAARHKVISFQAGLFANLLTYRSTFDELLETDWHQFAINRRLPSGSRLNLLDLISNEANRQIADYPRFADAIGSIHISDAPEYIAEATTYLGWWALTCEILWPLLEGSEIPIFRIFDPLTGLQNRGSESKWN